MYYGIEKYAQELAGRIIVQAQNIANARMIGQKICVDTHDNKSVYVDSCLLQFFNVVLGMTRADAVEYMRDIADRLNKQGE